MGVSSIAAWLAVFFEVVLCDRWLRFLLLLSLSLLRLLRHAHQEHLLRLALLGVVARHGCRIVRRLMVLHCLVALVAWSSRRWLLLRLLARLRQLLRRLGYGGPPRGRLLLLDLKLVLLNLHLLLGLS